MRAAAAVVSRGALALAVTLLLLACANVGPVHAAVPVPFTALGLAPWVVALTLATALLGRERGSPHLRPWVTALGACVLGLVLTVVARGPGGAEGAVTARDGVALVVRGPIDLSGADTAPLPGGRLHARWEGQLRVPRRGAYAFWIEGAGRLRVRLDDRPLLDVAGSPARAETLLALAPGPHRLRVEGEGRDLRVRLGWVPPALDGRAGVRAEIVPPRFLGEQPTRAWWWATDALATLVALLGGGLVFLAPWERPRGLPHGGPTTPRELLVSAAGHAALALVLTWPLASDPARVGPLHRPDARLNAWILGWNAHALIAQPGAVFQAPIFHPLPDALAFTEHLLLPSLLASPATLAGGPVLGFNLVFLTSIVSAGLGAQLLARRAGGDPRAAFVAGVLFSLGAWRFTNWAHLHAHATLFFPWGLVALDAFYARRTWHRAALLGLIVALQALCSVYLGAIQGVAVAVVAGVVTVRERDARALLRVAVGALLAAALVAPASAPYFRMRAFQGAEFTLDEVRTYATTAESYLASGSALWAPWSERHLPPERRHDDLFPGVVTLLLGLAGFAAAPPRWRVPLLAASVVAIVLSLGPETAVYRFLHAHVVPLRALRALARFALVPALALSVWAACALARRRGAWLVAAAVLALAENARWPARLEPVRPPSAATRWLAGRPGAVAVLPIGENDTQVMLDGLAHLRPLVNGDSGFVPRPYARLSETLGDAPWEERLRLLRALGVTHVVAREDLPLPLGVRLGDERVYAVPDGARARPPGAGGAHLARRTEDGWQIDLGVVRRVGEVAFELGDRAWVSRPRVGVSVDGVTWDQRQAEASLADATLALYRDPRHGRGAVKIEPTAVRYVKLPAELPMRGERVWVGE